MPRAYDIAVIGGGIVGMATALALTVRPGRSVIVLEAEDRVAAHQSGNNSGVIHSGLYYKPGSLKARNCATGRAAMYEFCQRHQIPHERCGKLVVATRPEEVPALEELERRGRANGLLGLQRLHVSGLRDHEPHVTGVAALLVPETGIVDYAAVTRVMQRLAQEQGGAVILNARFHRCRRRTDGLALETTAGALTCRHLINCAGLQADRVARRCGVDPGVQIIPFRGEYYELVPRRCHLVRNLIYPVPDPRLPFLGVHFTRRVSGGVEAGPNAVLALRREGYRFTSFSLRDVLEMIRYPGFWLMSRTFWRTGLEEFHRSLSRRAFWLALRRLVPDLGPDDIRPAGAGVRAQAVEPSGKLVDDFNIVHAERMTHVLNAPSPAATASLSIGRSIAELVEKAFR